MMKWICGMNEKRNRGREGEREREITTPLLVHTIPVVGYRYVLTSFGIEKPKK